MFPTPHAVEEITSSWLSEMLSVPIDRVDIDRIGAGAGFMGQLARVTLHCDAAAARASVIVKMPSSDPGARAIGDMMRVWEREHCFYRDVAPLLNICVPRAFANVLDPPCLVLEDLAPAVPGDHVSGASVDQADRAIDVLARHHAAWFEHPLLDTLTWMPGLDDSGILMLRDTFAIGWPLFLERFGHELPARCIRWCEQFADEMPHWIGTHLDDPITLTHGDFRLDNLFFLADGTVAVIDWQMSMRAPGQADLVYFCANNLTVEARRQHEDALIERYVDGLHRAGVPVDAVTLSGVRRGYLEGLVFYAVSFGASLLTIDPANERGAALFDVLVRRTFAAIDDLDAGVQIGLPS